MPSSSSLEAAGEAVRHAGATTRRRFKYFRMGDVHKPSCKHLETCKDPAPEGECKSCIGKLPSSQCKNCVHAITETKLEGLGRPLEELLALYADVRAKVVEEQASHFAELCRICTTQPPIEVMTDYRPVHDQEEGGLLEQTPQVLLLQPKSCDHLDGLLECATAAQKWLVQKLNTHSACLGL